MLLELWPAYNINYGVFLFWIYRKNKKKKKRKSYKIFPKATSMRSYIVSNQLIWPLWVGEWFLFHKYKALNFLNLNLSKHDANIWMAYIFCALNIVIIKQCHNLPIHAPVIIYVNDNITSLKAVFHNELLISNYWIYLRNINYYFIADPFGLCIYITQ